MSAECPAIEKRLGTVKWYSAERGYGFVTAEDGAEYFVHWSGIVYEGAGKRRRLEEGQRVTFRLVQTPKGIQARGVLPVVST